MGLRDRLLGKRTPEDAFAAEVEGIVRELLPVSRVERTDRLTLELTFADGDKKVMFLHNLFAETSGVEGDEREKRLRYRVLALTPSEPPATWDEAAPRVMPAVRAIRPRQLSPVPCSVVDGSLVEWTPPPGDHRERIVDRCRHVLALVEHTVQRNALVEQMSAAGEDVFVATYNLMELPDGSVEAWVAWTKGVESLLPCADVVAFVDIETNDAFRVRWEEAERIASHALGPEPESDPPRWRVSDWPDEPSLEQLRAVAIDAAPDDA